MAKDPVVADCEQLSEKVDLREAHRAAKAGHPERPEDQANILALRKLMVEQCVELPWPDDYKDCVRTQYPDGESCAAHWPPSLDEKEYQRVMAKRKAAGSASACDEAAEVIARARGPRTRAIEAVSSRVRRPAVRTVPA